MLNIRYSCQMVSWFEILTLVPSTASIFFCDLVFGCVSGIEQAALYVVVVLWHKQCLLNINRFECSIVTLTNISRIQKSDDGLQLLKPFLQWFLARHFFFKIFAFKLLDTFQSGWYKGWNGGGKKKKHCLGTTDFVHQSKCLGHWYLGGINYKGEKYTWGPAGFWPDVLVTKIIF